jgi:hypothetical protein
MLHFNSDKFRNRSSINILQTPNDVFDGSWWDLHWSDLAVQLLCVVVVGLLYVVLLYITIFRKITPILKKDSLYNTVTNCRELPMNYGNIVIYRSLCMVTCCQSNCKFSDCQISLNLGKLDQAKIEDVTTNSPRFMSMLSMAVALSLYWSRLVALHR